jgi:hypothetical protein
MGRMSDNIKIKLPLGTNPNIPESRKICEIAYEYVTEIYSRRQKTSSSEPQE